VQPPAPPVETAAPVAPAAAPPVAIERPEAAPVTLTSGEEPRATMSMATQDRGSASRFGGSIALVAAALITGILVGIMAVIRMKPGGAPPNP
jgi:hypothetical protein